jgi:hypothetical protein
MHEMPAIKHSRCTTSPIFRLSHQRRAIRIASHLILPWVFTTFSPMEHEAAICLRALFRISLKISSSLPPTSHLNTRALTISKWKHYICSYWQITASSTSHRALASSTTTPYSFKLTSAISDAASTRYTATAQAAARPVGQSRFRLSP